MLLELSAAIPRRRAGFVTVFVALVVLAPVIAAADVPDPTWIGGCADGAGGRALGAAACGQWPAPPLGRSINEFKKGINEGLQATGEKDEDAKAKGEKK